MKISTKISATALAIGISLTSGAFAQDRLEIGRLQCNVEGGIGLIIGSSKDAVCEFFDADASEPTEIYFGKVNKFGLDIGFTEKSTIQWLVLASKTDAYSEGSLAGQYVGLSAEATVGIGVGGNLLVGGSSDNFTLQPLSVQGQTGLNIAAGVTGFTLRTSN